MTLTVPLPHQCRRSSLVLIVLAAIAASSASAAVADDWSTYHNDRYGTTIDYPNIFKAQPPPDADDGRAFKTADGADFSVSASYNALDFNLATFRDFIIKNLDPGAVVTYQAHGDDWFVVSGMNGANIFYERHLLSHHGEMTENFVMSYPASLNRLTIRSWRGWRKHSARERASKVRDGRRGAPRRAINHAYDGMANRRCNRAVTCCGRQVDFNAVWDDLLLSSPRSIGPIYAVSVGHLPIPS